MYHSQRTVGVAISSDGFAWADDNAGCRLTGDIQRTHALCVNRLPAAARF